MIRRQVRDMLPALALLGIMPWHIDPDPPVLTFGEMEAFARAAPLFAKKTED